MSDGETVGYGDGVALQMFTVEAAERTLRAISPIERPEYVEYIEQLVAPEATIDLQHLRCHSGLPIFADESIHGLGDVRIWLAEPAAVSGVCLKLRVS
ncbi:enolase C-terminal domain-like protein [Halalkalirubrum salinum]|uniref:enolase C-terminal domain-like protein n=1 Tax=Halalkalirubrum salinum TaxID=2563889 RepID=UPI0010FB96F5|nr:enolase C-terminal domain-like protein [Halalkalirubrum salinum]